MESDVGCRLLHLLGRALPASFLAQVDKIGMITIPSLVVCCMASLAGTAANESVVQWQKLWQRLYTESELRVTFIGVLAGFPWLKHWCALSFVAVLRAAANGKAIKHMNCEFKYAILESEKPPTLRAPQAAAYEQIFNVMFSDDPWALILPN